jgi:hypothetical protein
VQSQVGKSGGFRVAVDRHHAAFFTKFVVSHCGSAPNRFERIDPCKVRALQRGGQGAEKVRARHALAGANCKLML